MNLKTTRDVLAEHKQPYHTLHNLIRSGRFQPPAKTSGGMFLWTAKDVARFLEAVKSVTPRRKEPAPA